MFDTMFNVTDGFSIDFDSGCTLAHCTDGDNYQVIMNDSDGDGSIRMLFDKKHSGVDIITEPNTCLNKHELLAFLKLAVASLEKFGGLE